MKVYSRILCCLFIVFTCFLSISWKSTESEKSSNLSGEQMFRDIIFFEGELLSKKIPEYAQFKKTLTETEKNKNISFSNFKDFTINLINDADNSFFERFKSTIEENNPNSIKELLTTSLSLVSISEAIYISDPSQKKKFKEILNQSNNLTNLNDIKGLVENIDNEFRTLNSIKESANEKSGTLLIVGPPIIFDYQPPCNILVAACAVVATLTDVKSSLKNSTLLTEKIVAAIVTTY